MRELVKFKKQLRVARLTILPGGKNLQLLMFDGSKFEAAISEAMI